MIHRSNRQRVIAAAAPAPFAGPGHAVVIAALIALAFLLFTSLRHAHAGAMSAQAAMPVIAESGEVAIPAADIADGQNHFYSFRTAGKTVQFVLARDDGGHPHAVVNAGDERFPSERRHGRVMDVTDHDGPAPLPCAETDGFVLIRAADLAAAAGDF